MVTDDAFIQSLTPITLRALKYFIVQLEPIIPFPVELIMNFLLFIQNNNERIGPPNTYPVID